MNNDDATGGEDALKELLKGALETGRLPLSFQQLTRLEGPKQLIRLAESAAYRTSGYQVFGPGKPISKPFPCATKPKKSENEDQPHEQ